MVDCSGCRVPFVLLDNGSALNVCPLATTIALSFAHSDFGPSTETVRAYDSTKREVLRIPTSFNLLLGRPWIHRVGAIPSSLHQKERVRARLSHTPFDYPIRPYRMSLVAYFVRGSEIRPRIEEIHSVVHIDREIELQHLFHQLQLSDGALGTSVSKVITPMSPDRASMLFLCFSEEIIDDGVIVDPTEMIDGVVPHDEYREEMDMMTVSQITSIVKLQPVSQFDMFGVSTIEVLEGAQIIPVLELLKDDSSLFEGTIDDEVTRLDPNRDSSDHDSDPVDERVSPTTRDVETVDFGTEDQSRELTIGSNLSIDEKDRLIHLLRSYLDVFAWSYEDMPGLDPSIVHHILPHARPVKQKLRRLHPRWSLQYPEWLANVVSVPKKDGKVRVGVDFKDLNKASPKDDFPLPHIDLLVDSTAGHSMLSFMDGFSGYNQILRAPKDMEKTTFIIEWGTYYYKVMPFRLKNAEATYQRAITTLFHDMMHRDIEVYVDDMIVKSRGRVDHLEALERFFERIRKFRLRLNLKKCTFGVTFGKLLGHMVSERGIEVDPDKIKAILDMPVPKTEKEIRGFLGRLQYISRFIARLTDICEPIFRLLRKNQPTIWNDDYQLAFEKIKKYLLSPPILVPPTLGRPLLLYLLVSDMALGCMLAQIDDSGKERTIYYLTLVWVTRRLRHYMTEYSVHLISRLDPLRYLFDRPALTGRLMRWLVLLTEFDIQYVSQKSIKENEEFVAITSLSGWCMYFDGAANQSGYGIGVLLVSPQNDHIPRSVRLTFSYRHPIMNNLVEYEACILGLETALELGIRQMEDDLPWYHDIYQFLRSGTYPEVATAKDRRALRHLATRFVICGDTLYRRLADGMLLLCLDRASADRVMREVHAGVCGPHMGGHMLALWGIDIIGKVSPKSSNGHEFILVAIDYFTKWVEAASYARLTSVRVASFIKSHIICHYGVPPELISDRGKYGIQHHRSSAYRPQTNGAVEAANKNIKRILRKMVETSRDWSKKLSFALWAYRTSFRTSTEATPYSLVYGMEAVLPVEMEMGSLRRKMARAFRKRVKPRPLQKGDLVLRILRGLIGDPRGKFRPSWSGPYVIRELTLEGAAWLTDLDGNQFSEPTNVDQLKKYYV
uniref:Integrase catalytic domain-containing protein n=1 Tax=Vitis vinifera TaxID=29760 RepID=A5C3F2_VITVI|nr:hypothetical protein VITISV_035172 [Vitis vinifera]